MQRPLILAGNRVKINEQNGVRQPDDFAPRQDYREIAQQLGGKLVGYDLFDTIWYHWARQLEKRLKFDFVESLFVATQLSQHNVILSTSEKIAVPLAVLLSVRKQKMPHVIIAHKLSSGLKTHLFQVLRLHRTFSHIICVCRAQVDYAINRLGVSKSRVDFVYDKVDHHFFYPQKVDDDGYILAVGQEQRDYETLLRAVSGIGVRLVVIASSPWSTSRVKVDELEKVTVLSHISFQELRTLYAKARLVVVPLFDVDYAAGVNATLEAMAMAKPVIVSQTSGIKDYIADAETGKYVSPGDSGELRNTILSSWEQFDELNRLGTNARQCIEERMNLDIYVSNVVQIVRKTIGELT